MKALLMVALMACGLGLTGCGCADMHYPHDTFIGSSGWPSSQVPLNHVAAVQPSDQLPPVQ